MRAAIAGWLLRAHERWVRWAYAPLFGLVAALAVRFATRRAHAAAPRLARLGRRAMAPSSCCAEGSPERRLERRFVGLLDGLAERGAVRELLEPAQLAATRRWTASLGRVALLQEARHAVVGWLRAQTGVPAVVLAEAQIAVAPDCELACAGCYARPSHGGREPTVRSILRAVDEAAALGATAIHLVGKGEPLAPRARGLVVARAIAARPHLVFTVATGAPAVDDDVIGALARAGNAVVLVAVEGPPAVHDARRGAGSFERAARLMEGLRARGVPFGFSAMVARGTREALADRALVASLAAQGCLVGVYARYFPLAPDRAGALALRPPDVAAWRAALADLRRGAPIPLVDLDELEEDTGCRSRLGRSLYIDATTGVVAPCLRVPFAPEGVPSLDAAHLDAIVEHPFFAAYRARAEARCLSCGVDLERELADVEADLAAAGARSPALSAYRARAASRRALPLTTQE